MTEPARILIVDDSQVVCKVLRRALDAEPDFTVIDVAHNGKIALEKLQKCTPDAITLDIEMPEMDGLQTLKVIKERYPDLPVVMVSSLTMKGAEVTVEALLGGAASYIQKPAFVGDRKKAIEQVRDDLTAKLRAVLGKDAGRTATEKPVAPKRIYSTTQPQVLAIGSSTGGPVALLEVLRDLPTSFPLPIVIAQHMPPMFTEMLAKRLSTQTSFRVQEGFDGAVLSKGDAWIAPGDFHMEVVRGADGAAQLALNQAPPVHSCRPAVDVLFNSVAQAYGGAVVATVLTGMGQDGLAGARAIREQGGTVFAQDEATSVVWGMPGLVAREGVAHEVVPLDEMAATINTCVTLSPSSGAPQRSQGEMGVR